MKSTELYKVLRRSLAPALKQGGFQAAKGGTFYWTAPVDKGFIRFSITNSRHGWNEPFGSSLVVSIQWSETASRTFCEMVEGAGRTHVLDFLDEAAIREYCAIRNSVIDKGLRREPAGLVAMIGDAVDREMKELERLDFPLPLFGVEFPWLDQDDIERWAGYWAARVPALVPMMQELLRRTPVERQRIALERWKALDTRSPEERAARKARKSAALRRSIAAVNSVVAALEDSGSSN